MSFTGLLFNVLFGYGDQKRNAATPFPEGVECCADISYGPVPKWNELNVYYPKGTVGLLPTIVHIHGGGFVYGSKEGYHFYCADLARRGFTVVNFNYRLAPKWHFPAPLEDTNAVFAWMKENAERFHIDLSKVILAGDSAGAQLTSHYAAIVTNPEFAKLFAFSVSDIPLRAVGLNCGFYDFAPLMNTILKGPFRDYLGRKAALDDPRLQVMEHITFAFPPAHITSAHNDPLLICAQPMYQYLTKLGVAAECVIYGTPEQKEIGHVFHTDIRLAEAGKCNDAQCAFFRKYI